MTESGLDRSLNEHVIATQVDNNAIGRAFAVREQIEEFTESGNRYIDLEEFNPLSRPGGFCFVLESDSGAVGLAKGFEFQPPEGNESLQKVKERLSKNGYERVLWLDEIGLLEKARGTGGGSKLIDAVTELAKRQGYDGVASRTWAKRDGYLLLNVKRGAYVVGYEEKENPNDNRIDLFIPIEKMDSTEIISEASGILNSDFTARQEAHRSKHRLISVDFDSDDLRHYVLHFSK